MTGEMLTRTCHSGPKASACDTKYHTCAPSTTVRSQLPPTAERQRYEILPPKDLALGRLVEQHGNGGRNRIFAPLPCGNGKTGWKR